MLSWTLNQRQFPAENEFECQGTKWKSEPGDPWAGLSWPLIVFNHVDYNENKEWNLSDSTRTVSRRVSPYNNWKFYWPVTSQEYDTHNVRSPISWFPAVAHPITIGRTVLGVIEVEIPDHPHVGVQGKISKGGQEQQVDKGRQWLTVLLQTDQIQDSRRDDDNTL